MPNVSIIVPCMNDKHLYNLVKDLNNQIFKDFELLIIASKEEQKNIDIDKLKKLANFGIRLITADNPVANKRNVGVKEAEGKYIVFLDDDVRILEDTWLEKLINKIENSSYDVIGGLLLEDIQVGETEALPSNNIIFRKDIYIPMDTNFPYASAEDTDWCFRLYMKGYKLYQDCIAPVQHKKFTFKKKIKRSFIQGREWAHILVKHGNLPYFKWQRLILSFIFRAGLEFLKLVGFIYGLVKYGIKYKIFKKR